MKIWDATAASSIIYLDDMPYCISPPSIRDYGTIFLHLRDTFPTLEDQNPNFCPSLNDPLCVEELDSDSGFCVILYIALRRDNPEIRLRDAFALSVSISPEDRAKAARIVLQRHPRDEGDGIDASHWKRVSRDPGRPIHEINFGQLIERARIAGFSPDVIAGWTLDQLENKLQGGGSDDARSIPGMIPLQADEFAEFMQRMSDPEEIARVAELRGEPIPPWAAEKLPGWILPEPPDEVLQAKGPPEGLKEYGEFFAVESNIPAESESEAN